MIIECFNTKQVIVGTISLQLLDIHDRCYCIFDHDKTRLWRSKQRFHSYIVDPRLIAFIAVGTIFKVKAIPETLDSVIYNSFSESSGYCFRIILH